MANPTIGFIGYGNMAQAIAEASQRWRRQWRRHRGCAAHYDKLERNAANSAQKRCVPPRKSPKQLTWSSSPSNRIRLKR